MENIREEATRLYNEMKKRGLPIVKIMGDESLLTLYFLPCDAPRVQTVLSRLSPGNIAEILGTPEEYCNRFQNATASRDVYSQDFHQHLLTNTIFFDTERLLYKDVELRRYCKNTTQVDLVDLKTNTIAQIHLTCQNPATDARKKRKKNGILNEAAKFFKEHYDLEMRLFRIDGYQRPDGWGMLIYNIKTKQCYSDLSEILK